MRRWTFIASLAIMERDVPLPFAHLPRIRTNFTWFLPILETAVSRGETIISINFFPLPFYPPSPCFLANLNFVKKEAPFAIGISFRHANESAHCVEADCVVLHVVWDFLWTVCDFMEFLHGKGIVLWVMERFGEAFRKWNVEFLFISKKNSNKYLRMEIGNDNI